MLRYILFLLVSINLCAADWRYVAESDSEVSFIDLDSVTISNGMIRYWLKDVELKTLSKAGENKRLIDVSGRKVVSGYIPPALKFENVKAKITDWTGVVASVIHYEVCANQGDVAFSARSYWELDLKEKRVRGLSVSMKDKKGVMKTTDAPDIKWYYIPPDSQLETTLQFLNALFLDKTITR